MATDLLRKKLQEEATCSICLEYYTDPVVLDCGHNFCRNCITRCWNEFPANTACPQCRKAVTTKNCRPNRPLANVVEILKQLNNQGKEESRDNNCGKHPEPSKVLFCKEDQVSVCLACEGTEKHRGHHTVPLEEAAQEYKDRFLSCIEILKNEKKEILAHKISAIRDSEELMKHTEKEKQKTMAEFKQLHHFLADQENFLLVQIQAVAREVVNKRNEHLSKLSADLFTLQNIIRQLEEKSLQPDNELLQDAEKTLERTRFERTGEQDLWVLLEPKDVLQEGYWPREVNVTLDAESAHPQLVLSCNGKSLRWAEKAQDVPESPKRFEKRFCIMGRQEFTAGRHFWVVHVGCKEEWAVGVATHSVKRKGFFPLNTEEGIFALGKMAEHYRPVSVPHSPPLRLSGAVKRIRVSLNYAGGQVTFYDADTATKLFAFTKASFLRETLHPFFWLKGEAHLSISI
ncbi:E3 ubiquitin-protein ligase TRIM39-like [Eublepharis macularius]|uniref:E3 ubiquitin-protein ligase TRIM39-like n=1 Tax=Eublepharis macularius TaxID=481883 RepID=A0AA97J6E8_EUBMA|nr:E3 ubiquitin-protein ligase TRIM39-like [Eublepharis macularius]